ncbi:hypothetical protein HK104_004910, partial [Borealophlyctis nickersoniae]
MDDATAIISNCQSLLSSPQTLTETDARAAAAACEAWLNKNKRQPAITTYSRSGVSSNGLSFPPEILDAILRKIPYHQRRTLLSCSLVNNAWRRNSWAHYWKELRIPVPLAPIAGRYLLPFALEATKGIQVRMLSILSGPSDLVVKDLGLLLATPLFSGIRVLILDGSFGTFHALLALRSLPNLTYLRVYGLRDEPVAWEKYLRAWEKKLRLNEREEEEAWKIGLGNLKALDICMTEGATGGIMMDKLAMGLGAKLESLSLELTGDETKQRKTQLARVLQNVSQKCPRLVRLFLSCWDWSTDSLRRFVTTQHQLVHLILELDVHISDQLIQTIAASCVNLKILSFNAPNNSVATRDIYGDGTVTVNNMLDFVRHRGRDLEYLAFPNDSNSPLAFMNRADKLENLVLGEQDTVPQEIHDAAIARGVKLLPDASLPDYVD